MDRLQNAMISLGYMSQNKTLYTIIIVDDEAAIRHGLVHYVDWKAMGFSVKTAFEDGKEAMAYLKNNKVDVVLTDIRMAEVSGLNLADFINKNLPETCVLLMSGYKEFEYAKQAITHNVREYLLKPVEIDQLKQVFEKLHHEIAESKALSSLKNMLPLDEERFIKTLIEKKPTSNSELESLIMGLINGTASDENKTSKSDYIHSIIAKAKEYIEENLSRDISLEDVSDHIYLSPVYFSRFFKEHNGKNFIIYVTEQRMKRAKQLLESRKYKVHEISQKVGYQSSKYFTRVFKKTYGITPTEYLHTQL
jgi:two-component system, response regulator YesN